jgi:hypothetical protein
MRNDAGRVSGNLKGLRFDRWSMREAILSKSSYKFNIEAQDDHQPSIHLKLGNRIFSDMVT